MSDERLSSATELAKEFAVTPRALRFYESKGLLSPQRAGAPRGYDYRDRARLTLILRGKRLGFTLAQIREYLELYTVDTDQVGQLTRLRALVARRVTDLEERRAALEITLAELKTIARQVDAALSQRRRCVSSSKPNTATGSSGGRGHPTQMPKS